MSWKFWRKTKHVWAYEFYHKQPYPKACYATYIRRVYKWESFEQAIVRKREIKNVKESPTKKYFDNYEGEKATYWIYMKGIQCWLPKEQAIKKGLTVIDYYPKEREIYKAYKSEHKRGFSSFVLRLSRWMTVDEAIRPKKYVETTNPVSNPHKDNKRIYKESDYLIEITLKEEEALIYHRSYRSMINELEEKIYQEENYAIVEKLVKELDFINRQYKVFLSFNPISSWTKQSQSID